MDEIDDWDNAAEGMSENIRNLIAEEDMKLSEEVISQWIKKRRIEKNDKILLRVAGQAGLVLAPQKMKTLLKLGYLIMR